MYEEHFHLATSPFNPGPDPDCLYVTESVREALSALAYGVNRRKGFMLLTGDVGTGKTTILNVFMRWLQTRHAVTALVFNPHLGPDDFLELMVHDFGLEWSGEKKAQLMIRLNRWLLEKYHANIPVVLMVDEAQQLSEAVLEELRLLTNLETPLHKLMQIVLCGQPELRALLARPSLRQLRQRIGLTCTMAPLTAAETEAYIAHRLRTAGAAHEDLFQSGAIQEIFRMSRGIPRVINIICEELLIAAYCDGKSGIAADMVTRIARDNGLEATASSSTLASSTCAVATSAKSSGAEI